MSDEIAREIAALRLEIRAQTFAILASAAPPDSGLRERYLDNRTEEFIKADQIAKGGKP